MTHFCSSFLCLTYFLFISSYYINCRYDPMFVSKLIVKTTCLIGFTRGMDECMNLSISIHRLISTSFIASLYRSVHLKS